MNDKTLDRFDFSEPFENATCIIRKSVGFTTNELDPKKRSAAVFDDGTVCSIGMIYPIINS